MIVLKMVYRFCTFQEIKNLDAKRDWIGRITAEGATDLDRVFSNLIK